jgi:hypothetical protein
MLKSLIETYRRTRKYGTLVESPKDRLGSLTYKLFASETLPNILLGVALGFSIQSTVAVAWAAYFLSVVNYVVAKEVYHAAMKARNRFEDNPDPGVY